MKIGLEQLDGILARSEQFPPAKAVLPVLAGFSSYNPDIRKTSRETLFRLREKINQDLTTAGDPDALASARTESALFAARIFHDVRFNDKITENDVGIFFNVLMGAGPAGQFYAWRIWQDRFTARPYLKSQAEFLPDALKLAFVEQYLNASLAKRRIYANFFSELLATIRSRKAVIRFATDLFQRRRSFDPFLLNLPPALISAEAIRQTELKSQTAGIRSDAVIALSVFSRRDDTALLKKLLKNDPDRQVRTALLSILESAPPGAYPDLTPSLLKALYITGETDAMACFRTLARSGRFPPFRLIETIRANRPALMPAIRDELASYSGSAFMFAQDLARHPAYYNGPGRAIFNALVRGIIRRRPGILLKLLKAEGETRVSRHLKTWIRKEEAGFHTFVKAAKQRLTGLKKSAVSSQKAVSAFTAAQQKALKDNETQVPVWCQGNYFGSMDFTGAVSDALTFVFDECGLERCDLSGSLFRESSFKRVIFWDVHLDNTLFKLTDFDEAVFINVTARHAVFKGCSFRKAAFFNCDFHRSGFTDSILSQARISRTRFTRSNLTGTTFSQTWCYEASFEQSRTSETDFSGVRAKDCIFPVTGDADTRIDDTNFQTAFSPDFPGRIPTFTGRLRKRVRDLICADFIDYGRQRFLTKNRNALTAACDVFQPRTYDIFELVPFLLHENVSFPGYNSLLHKAPHGISRYVPSARALQVAGKYLDARMPLEQAGSDACRIQGLYTIGSTGTIAQNTSSDIDYWVCIDETRFTLPMKNALEEKLEKLEIWALDSFKTEIHFFILDILRVRQNDFGDAGFDNSGSAQAMILKDEFYRTMIYVAGRIPLWSVLPSAVCRRAYHRIPGVLKHFTSAGSFIDLGDIHTISENEYYGALIWQIFKGMKSAFKSVVKIALVEKYYFRPKEEPLLCNRFKDRWLNALTGLGHLENDPYYALLETLINYYAGRGDSQTADLIKLCFILHLSNLNPSDIEKSHFGIKKHFIHRIMTKGAWDDETVFKLGDLKKWHFKNIIKISDILKRHFLNRFRELGMALNRQAKGMISPTDRTILERKMQVQFSRKPGKIENLLLVVKNDTYFQQLYLRYDKQPACWELVHRSGKIGNKREEVLNRAPFIEELAAWMINNRLYTKKTLISMAPNATYVTSDDINRLFAAMYTLFSPHDRDSINLSRFLSENRTVLLFVSINFYASRTCKMIRDAVAVHINSWGEMFCHPCSAPGGFTSIRALEDYLEKSLGLSPLPGNRSYFVPKRFRGMAIN